MRVIRSIISALLLGLLFVVMTGFATSWHMPVLMDVWTDDVNPGNGLTIRSWAGRITITTTRGSVQVDSPELPVISREDFEALSKSFPEARALPAESPWAWLRFERQSHELPRGYFGGGTLSWVTIPYWVPLLAVGGLVLILRRKPRPVKVEAVPVPRG